MSSAGKYFTFLIIYNVLAIQLPLTHCLLNSLKDTEEGRAALTKMIVDEDRAVRSGEITPIGMNIVAEKVE